MQINKKGFVWLPVLLGILAVLAVSGGAWWYVHLPRQAQDTQISCADFDTFSQFILQRVQTPDSQGTPRDDNFRWKRSSGEPFVTYPAIKSSSVVYGVSSAQSITGTDYMSATKNNSGVLGRVIGQEAASLGMKPSDLNTLPFQSFTVPASPAGAEISNPEWKDDKFLQVFAFTEGSSLYSVVLEGQQGRQASGEATVTVYCGTPVAQYDHAYDVLGLKFDASAKGYYKESDYYENDYVEIFEASPDYAVYRIHGSPNRVKIANYYYIDGSTAKLVSSGSSPAACKVLEEQKLGKGMVCYDAAADTQRRVMYGTIDQGISVPGMSKYTDADFGFSFWYPSSWTVQSTKISGGYAGGSVQKSLTVAPPNVQTAVGGDITIDEFYSPTREISFPSVVCSPMQGSETPSARYYFDTGTHTWMVDTGAARSERGPQYDTPATTKAADVSHNTMGGLHQFWAGCTHTIVPLSAKNFLVLSYNRNNSPYYYNDLANTVIATDPSVATPASSAEQIKMITTVGILFGVLGTPVGDDWRKYSGVIYDRQGTPLVGADTASFRPVLVKGVSSGYAVDNRNVYHNNKVLQGADPATFSIIPGPDGYSSHFEKDAHYVWDSGTLIPGADPTTFAVVVNAKQPGDTSFQKDATHVWHYNKVLLGADPATFAIVNQAVWQSAIFETDASHVWYDGHLIPGAAPRTFVVDTYDLTNDNSLTHDASHSYKLFGLLGTISSTTVSIDGGVKILLQ